jgi:hypothetical protein
MAQAYPACRNAHQLWQQLGATLTTIYNPSTAANSHGCGLHCCRLQGSHRTATLSWFFLCGHDQRADSHSQDCMLFSNALTCACTLAGTDDHAPETEVAAGGRCSNQPPFCPLPSCCCRLAVPGYEAVQQRPADLGTTTMCCHLAGEAV